MLLFTCVLVSSVISGEESDTQTTEDRPTHQESARRNSGESGGDTETPPLPEGMTLDEVLEYSASSPPEEFPDAVYDDQLYTFTLFEKLEYRSANGDTPDQTGWEAQGWVGYDYNKFWWKHEGEQVFDGADHGESETDLLYSRLITPFWNVQVGAQYANEWNSDEYDDQWSGVVALQGMSPYKFEVDNSLYVTEEGDVQAELEAEYDVRVTQRFVLQPLIGIDASAQDIPEERLGAGITKGTIDFRFRYEIQREFAPYVGFRYQRLLGETENIAESAGEDSDQSYILMGIRLAF